MGKELCKIQDELIRRDLEAYMDLVNKPKHVCKKCGRVANKKKLLCKPTKLKKKRKPK